MKYLKSILLAILISNANAAVQWVESGITTSNYLPIQVLPYEITGKNQPDFRFVLENGIWSLSSLPEAGHGSVLAYGGTLSSILPGYSTLPGSNWAHVATLAAWWHPDGIPQWIGLLPNPANDDWEPNRYHGIASVSWNPDNSLTLHRWAYETEPGVPVAVPVPVPEPKVWHLVLMTVICILCFSRRRGS